MAKKFIDKIADAIERVSPSDYLTTLDRSREYDGQPWTDLGERGRTEIKGITFRDLRDCFIRACYEVSGLSPGEYPKSLYELPWDEIDPLALEQALNCWIERYMGIFPNVPPISEEEIWRQISIIEFKEDER